MIVGTAVPVILLAGIEVVLKAKEFIAPEYMAYISGRNVRMRQENAGDTEESKRTNRFTQKVLGIGLGLSGVLITVLGFIAEENIVVSCRCWLSCDIDRNIFAYFIIAPSALEAF